MAVFLERSGLPQPPQTKGVATAMLSIGDDISDIGKLAYKAQEARSNAWLEYDLKLKEMAQKHGLAMEEIEARKQADIEKERMKREPNEKSVAAWKEEMGLDPTDKIETDPTFRAAVEDESGGHTGVDQTRFEAYKKKQREGGLMARMLAASDNPEQSQKAMSEWKRRQLTLEAPNMDSALEGGRRMNTYQGDPEHAIEGNTGINKFTGKQTQTELGKAMTDDERASASHHGAAAGAQSALAEERRDKTKREAKDKTNNPAYAALKEQYGRAESEVNSLRGAITKATEQLDKVVGRDARTKLEGEIAAAKEELATVKKKRDDLATRMDNFTEDGPGAKAKKSQQRIRYDAAGNRERN